ncbi:hypothetical protein CSC2_20320 [Clostridium zeae]|uniref:Fibronectin type III domain-containing protein n=1 Tax=Clostridium zeae TaxID=2759022 RepID=A0ABQ1E9Y6_9CLOT|nr:fibronectin type III domain-containing protein [Clostridium zeae]GFZ31506.1 hypothetical protein CSC2_20320 [Clostridium zeae]
MVRKREGRFTLSIFTALVMFLSICQPALVRAEVIKASPPLNFKAEASITAIELSWQLTDRIDGCDLEVDGRIIPMGTKTSYRQDNLIPGSSHVYRIRAKNKNGTGEWSSELSVKAQIMEPYAPKDFKIINVTNSTVAMSWSEELGAKSYEVEVDGKVIESKSNTSFVRGGFDPESKHTFRVRAKNELGESDWSSGYEVTTFPNSPDTPKNLKLKSINNNSITIVWDKSDKAEGYEVVADNKLIDNGTSNEFTHKGISVNDEHTYFVRAKNSGGVSEWSSGIKIKIPTQPEVKLTNDASKEISLPTVPSNITLKSAENSITVNWDTSKNAELYDIEVDGNIISNLKENTYTQTDLLQGTSHTYRVRGKTKYIIGAWSSLITGFTKLKAPNIPKNLNANAVSSDCIVAAWDMVTGATGYDLEVDGKVIDVGINIKYVNTQLKEASTHYYRVRAKNSGGNSEWSEKISTQTLSKNKSIEQSNTGNQVSQVSVPRYQVAENTAEVIHVDMNLASDTQVQNAVVQAAADTTAPTAPGSLALVSKTYNSVNLKWNASTDNVKVTSYDIYNGSTKVGSTTTGTTYTVTGLLPNTSYSFTVKARDAAGNTSAASNTLTVTTSSDTTAPSAPTNLTTSTKSCTSVGLSWAAATDNVSVTGYDVYNGSTKVGSTTTATTYTVTGLLPNTSYTFTIKARDAAGNTSASSNSLAVTTLADTTAPNAPTNLVASNNSYTSVSLSWTASTDNIAVTGYDVYDGTSKIGSTTNTTTYTVSGLTPNTSHQFTVKARDAAGNTSASSNSLTVTTLADTTAPSAPTSLNVVSKTCISVNLSWAAATDNIAVSGYEIYKGSTKVGETNGLTYTVSGLTPNTAYSFTVKAKDAAGNLSQASTSLSVTTTADTTAPTAPINLTVVSKDYASISLSWTASTDNVGVVAYDIYKGTTKVGQTNGETTYTVNGLSPDTSYSLTVKARDLANNTSSASAALVVKTNAETQPPTVPSNLVVTSHSISEVAISWNQSTDNIAVVGYDIFRDGIQIASVGSDVTSYTDSGLNPNTQYKYTIKAKDQAGNISNASSELSVTTDADTVPPTNPSNLIISSVGGWYINLSWSLSTDNGAIAGYDIYCNGSKVGSSTTTSYTATGLQLTTQYSFVVKARDIGGNESGESNSVTATTYSDDFGDSTSTATSIDLGKTKSATINYVGDYDYFTFIAPISSSYTITTISNMDTYGYIYDENGNLITYDDDNGADYNFQITADLISGHRYYIATRHFSSGTGDYKVLITVLDTVNPTKPSSVSVLSKSAGTVTISWTAATDNIAILGYEIYRDGLKVATVEDNITSYTDTGLLPATQYKYTVKAKDQAGNLSGVSNEISVTTDSDIVPPTAPTNVAVSSKTGWAISLSWSPSTDDGTVAGYDIYCNGTKVGSSTTTSYTCTGLQPNSEYVFTIKAYDLGGNRSDNSSSLSSTTYNDDHGDSISTATAIQIASFYDGQQDYDNDKDYFKFTTTDAGKYNAILNIISGSCSYSMGIYDENGNYVPSNYVGSGGYYILSIDATANKTYYILPGIYSIGGIVRYSIKVAETQPPTVPSNVQVTSSTLTSVSLSWNAATDNYGISGYEIYRNGVKVGTTSELFYTDTGLSSSTTYTYTVKAVDTSSNLSDASLGVDATTSIDTVPPTAPSGLVVTSTKGWSITLSWNASTDNGTLAGYDIYCNGNKIGSSTSTSYICEGLQINTEYVFKVKARDSGGNISEESNSVTGKTLNDDYGDSFDTATNIDTGKVKSATANYYYDDDYFSFIAPRDGQYIIKITNGIGEYLYLYNKDRNYIAGNYNSTNPVALLSGERYYVRIYGYNTGNYNFLVVVPDTEKPTTPTNVSLVSKNIGTISISWTASTDNIAVLGYEIYRDGVKIATVADNVTSYTDTGLAPNTEYKYTVKAKDQADNLSDVSSELSVTTDGDNIPPTSPTNLTWTSKTGWTIGLSWGASTDNGVLAAYDIYCNGSKIGSSTTTSYTCAGLNLNTQYTYIVKARDLGGNISGDSNSLIVSTYSDDYGDSFDTATNIDPGKIKSAMANYYYDDDYFSFIAPRDGQYIIKIANGIGEYIYLYDKNRNYVAGNYNSTNLVSLVSGQKYYVRIYGYNTGNYNFLVVVPDTEKPTAPTNVSLVSKSIGSISISWTASTDNIAVAGYEIYRDGVKIATVADNVTSYTDTGLIPNTEYKYTIKAKDQADNLSDVSSELSVTTDVDSIPPTNPTNLAAPSKTGWTVNLSWGASTDNGTVTGYDIYCNGSKIGSSTTTSYTCTGLTPNTQYIFTVKARDLGGNSSGDSNSVTVSTYSDDYGDSFDTATNVEPGKIKSANINYSGDVDYFTFIAPLDGTYVIKLTSGVSENLYLYDKNRNSLTSGYNILTASALKAGDRYYLKVPYYNTGVYNFIIVVQETEKPTSPTNVSLVSKSIGSISISWTASTDNIAVSGYEIYRDGVKIAAVADNVTSYTDSGLIPNTEYKYTIKAKDQADNLSDVSSELSVTTDVDSILPTNPTNLAAPSKTGWTVNLSWGASTDNGTVTGYDIYCNGSKIGSSTTTSYTCTGLNINTQYIFTVKARDLGGNMSGDSNSVTVLTYSDDYGDSFGTATNVDIGKSKSGTINYSGDYDYFTFIAPMDSSYRIISISSMDTYGYIYDENKNLIKSDDDNGEGANFQIDTTLTSGHRYYIAVRHYSSTGTGEYKLMITVAETEKPTSPTNVSLVSKSIGSISISWTVATDNIAVSGYEIYRDGLKIGAVADNVTSYTDTGLIPNTEYKYTIKAKDQADNLSDASSELSVTTDVDSIPPTNPTNLVAPSKTGWTVSLSWGPSTDNGTVAGYDIYCNGSKIGSSTTTSYTCTGLTPNTQYIFTVKARDLGGNISGDSNSVTVSTYSDDYGDSFDTATNVDPGKIKSANINYSGDVDYFTFIAPLDGTYVIKMTSGASEYLYLYDKNRNSLTSGYNTLTATALKAGDRYYLKIPYYNTGVYNFIIIVPETEKPTSPTNVSLVSKSIGSISISWTASTDNIAVSGYEVYRDGVKVAAVADNVTSYTDTGLAPNTAYKYTVKAKDQADNLSDESSELSVTTDIDNTPPTNPTNLTAPTKTGWTINLTWGVSTDDGTLAGYDIYCNGIKVGSSTTTSYTCTGLNPNTEYIFTVKARDLGGNLSAYSNSVIISTYADDCGDSFDTAVSIDAGKTKSASIETSYDADYFTFVAPVDGQYIIKLTSGSSEYLYLYDKNRTSVTSGYNTLTASALKAGDRYYLKVPYYNTGAYNFLIVVPDTEKPTAPSNLSIVDKSLGSITISWSASTDNYSVAGYEVYRDGVKITTVVSNILSYTDTGLSANTQYKYTIKAKDQADNLSDLSSELAVSTDKSDVSITNLSNTSRTGWTIGLSWSVTTGTSVVDRYEIYGNGINLGSTKTTSFICTALRPNTVYKLIVKAIGTDNGVLGNSSSITVTTYDDDYGDTFDTATSLELGKIKSGSINYSSDYDYLTFNALSSGTSNIKVINGANVNLYLYDKNKNVMTSGSGTISSATLVSGETYYLRISYSGTGSYSLLITVPETEKPTVPTGLNITNKTVDSITISWQPATDNYSVIAYEIYRDGVKVGTVVGDITSYKDSGLLPNTTYSYTIKAKDQADNLSELSDSISAITNADDIPPTNPSGLSYSSKTGRSVIITWSASRDNGTVASYDIYCNGTKVGNSTSTSYTCIGLQPNTLYTFTVRAKDLGGNTSGDSNGISVTTYDDDYGDDFDTATSIDPGKVKSANMNYSNDNDYFIFIAPNDGQYTVKITSAYSEYLYIYDKNRTLLTSGNSSTSAVTLKAGERYYLKVSYYNSGNYSFLIVVPETEKPTAPASLNVTSKSEGSITISWATSTDNFSVLGYQIFRNGTKIADVASNVLTFTDSGLSPSTEYKYTVRAKDQANNLSDASSELSVITAGDNVPPSNPTNLQYTARTGNSITLSWSASTDNGTLAGYDIYCNGSKVGSSTTTSYTCTGLQANTQYLFTVRARDLGGNVSSDSNVLTVSTCLVLSLGQDTVINGDFTMHDGDSLNLNGHRFEVHGNFDQLGGTVTINKGLLIITGNYKVSNGTNSNGLLYMTDSADYVQVQGNFIMESRTNHLGMLTAGILEVKGNFTQIQISAPCNFWTTDNHIVLLSGSSVQYISFATAPTSIFNILITTKPLATGYVFNTIPSWRYLIENYKIDTNFGLMTGDGAYGPTGNFAKSFTDLKTGNDGSDAEFIRTYNSKDIRETTGFGKGWSFSYECSITDFSGNISTKVVRLPDGSAQTFKINADGTFTAMDSRNTLTKQGDGSYILATKDQHSYGFNSNGYLIWVKDKNSNTTAINVDSNGKVTSLTDEVGRSYTISYNDSGLISTITDCLGRVVKYEYDNKKLVKVTDPMNHFTTYAYDSYGFLTEIRAYDNSLIESITYNHNPGQNQDKVDHTIDQYGNVLTYSYDTIHLKTTITDSNGRQTIQTFDSSFNIISSTDAEGKVTTYEYNKDSSGVNNFNEQKTLTDRNGGVTRYERDSVGNITKVTNPDGSYKEYGYDSKNNVIREKDESGNLTFYIYDSNGINMVKQARPLNGTDIYSDSADQTKFAITQYSYYSDSEAQSLGYRAKGLLKQAIDPMGGRTTYTYDSYGNVFTVTDGENNTTTYEYNSIGWKTKATSPQGYLTEYFYDNNGNVEKTILNHSSVTRTVYDSLGRVIKVISANVYDSSKDDLSNHDYSADAGIRYTYYSNGKVKAATDAENNTTTYTYDVYGNKLTETKANGAVYRYVYDVMNRVSKIYFKADTASSEQLLLEYAYGILTNGGTTKTETKYINATTSVKTITTFDYVGRVTSIQNPDNTTSTKVYNSNGTLSSSKDANGNVTYYKYDGLNRLIAIWTPFENVNGTVYYSYTAVEYDKAGRKTKESFGKTTVVKDGIPQTFITTAYEYYNNGNLKAQSDSAGRRLEYTYDKDGNISSKVVKVDDNTNRVTEYTNNEFGKPTTMKVHVYAGDIYTNAYTNNSDLILTTTYTFDKEGNVLTETYPDNSVVSYTYDKLGRILSTSQQGKDENGHDVTITTSQTYNWEGKVLTKTDGNGNTTTYVYDARGFLVKMVDAKGNTTAYYYDLAGRKIAEVSPNNYDSSKTLQNLSRTEYNYDLMDRVKTKVSVYFDKVSNSFVTITSAAFKYDNNGNVVKELDAAGYEAGAGSAIDDKINSGYGKIYSYNLANKLLTVLDADSQDRLLPYTKKYTYDGTGRKITETDGKGKVTTWYYDDANNITRTTIKRLASEAEVTVSSATYNNTGDVVTATDGNGNITTYEYTGFGKIKKVTYPGDSTIAAYYVIYQYDTVGRVIRKQDSLGGANIYTYDSAGRELTSTEEKVDGTEAIEVATTYDKNGNKRFLTDANGTVTENTYDELNRLVTSTIYVTDGSGNKVKHTTSYIYDKNSNLLKEIDWLGNEKTYVYDALDRVVEKYDQDNKLVQKLEYYHNGTQAKSYDALQNVTLYYYDKNNRLIKTVDPEGHITLQHYDEVGNIDQKTDGDSNTTYYSYDQYNRLVSVKNAKGEITNYTYDLNGNMLTQVDAQGNTTTFEYNVANKLIRKIFHGGRTGSSGSYTYDSSKTESYTYYASGDLRTKVDRNGVTSTYTYDIHGRKTSETIGSITNSFSYDDNGNQISITDATGTTTRTYDELNRVTSKSVPTVGTIVYKYDIFSGINGLDTGNFGESETDPKGNITLKIYDKAGRIKKVIAGTDTTTYNYYDNGSLYSVVYPNGYSEEYTYYKDNLLRTLANKAANGTVIESYGYTYDNAHNMLSKTDIKGTTRYTYDELNRLKTVTEPSGKVTTYTYTSAGNRNTETVVEGSNTTVKTYTYDSLNRLLSIIVSLNTVTVENTSYTYDNNGNQLTSKVDDYLNGILQSSMLTTNVYDSLNQLIQTTTPDNTTIKNIYNGEGLRVEKQVGNSSTKYLYSSDKVVLELDGNGNLIARNIYGINLLERITDSNKAYYLYNGHADTTKLIAQDGTVLNSYYYDAFGNITESNENMDNPYRYAGYQYDKETKTYYVIARMYDPSTGRFLQEDSYSGDINDPLSLNLYTYCENEPIKHDDPTGHFLHIAIGALVGGIIGAGANLVSDFMDDGKINSGWKSYAGAFVEGAVVGGAAAATGGLSLLASAGAVGAASFVGNVANQYISKSKVDWKEAAVSGVLGVATEVGGKLVGKLFANTKAGKAILGKVDDAVGSLKNKLSAVKEKVAQTAEKSLNSIKNKFDSIKLNLSENNLFSPQLAVEGMGKLPSKALNQASEYMNVEKNDIQKNFLKVMQERDESLASSSVSKKAITEDEEVKRIAVGESGHHVPAVRKSRGRIFEVGRDDKTRPTLFSRGADPGHDHWRLHNAEREFVGPRQGDFQGTDTELFDAYRNAYKDLGDIKVDVRSPNNTHTLGENVTPYDAVDLMQNWLQENGLWEKQIKK